VVLEAGAGVTLLTENLRCGPTRWNDPRSRCLAGSRSSVFRLIVIGCGRVFRRYHLRAIRSNSAVTIVGAVEPDPGRLDWARETLGNAVCGPAVDDVIDDIDADGVLVATPPAFHAEIAARCLRRGFAVLVEKPLTLDISDARRVVAAQREADRPLLVGFNRRFYRPYAALKERLRERGTTTEITYVFVAEQERWHSAPPGVGQVSVLHDLGCHALDLVRYMTDSPLSGLRASSAQVGQGGQGYEMRARTESGVEVRCRVGHGGAYEEWLAVTTTDGTHRVRIAGGSPGSRLVGNLFLATRRLTGRPTMADAAFSAQLRAFVGSCGGSPSIDAAGPSEGLAAVEGVRAAEESLEAGGAWRSLPNRRSRTIP